MSKILNLIEKIKNPDREFSPIPFWFLNDAFEDAEIIRQLEDFNRKGVHGVVLHPRLGIPKEIEYLSDEFMHYIGVAIETAARLDMKVVLYDEAMYPSGSAHGLIAASNPRFATQGLLLVEEEGRGKLIAKTKSGKFLIQEETDGRIRGIHFGEDEWEKDAPRGADLLSKDAMIAFTKITHDRYFSLFGKYFGNTIIGFFTDEPSLIGGATRKKCKPWTWGFEEVITAAGGKLEELEGLFTGEENETTRLYHRLVFERECETYYKTLSDWCQGHGIALMGHPPQGTDIECERYFGIPGQDVVWRVVSPEGGGLDGAESAQAKCSSDSARVLGNRRNSNECFGACFRDGISWYFPFSDYKWYLDWLAVRGVNLFIPHAFYYSVAGARKDERPPDVGPNNIWWEHYDLISTYIKRLSYIMTDAPNCAKVAVMCENRSMPTSEIKWLYQNQIEFNYLPYAYVPEGAYRDGKLTVGNNTYEYIVNDHKNMFPEMKHIEGASDLSHRDIYTAAPKELLRVSSVVKSGIRMWLLVNEGDEPIDTEASLEGEGKLLKVDLWSGEAASLKTRQEGGRAHFKLHLGYRESMLLMFGDEEIPEEAEKQYATLSFSLVREDSESFVKYYEGSLRGTSDNLYLSLFAEEMVECFVNGVFAGVSFLNKHEFFLSPYLTCGENKISLKITASAANRFTEKRLEYGLWENEN